MLDIGKLLGLAETALRDANEEAAASDLERIAYALESIAASQLVLAGVAADQMQLIVNAQQRNAASGLVVPQ